MDKIPFSNVLDSMLFSRNNSCCAQAQAQVKERQPNLEVLVSATELNSTDSSVAISKRKIVHYESEQETDLSGSCSVSSKKICTMTEDDDIENTIIRCDTNADRYCRWLNAVPTNFLSCPKIERDQQFIPVTRKNLLVYDGGKIMINKQGLSAHTSSILDLMKERLEKPKICSAFATPALAAVIVSMLPKYHKISLFVPMAGAGILCALIQEAAKNSGKAVDIFPYDLRPVNSCVQQASVGTRDSKEGDSFGLFAADINSKEDKMPKNLYPPAEYNHFVMLLDFPQFDQENPQQCPLRTAIYKFMTFPTPKVKQIIYWGIGKAADPDNGLQVENPFEQAIKEYNEQVKKNWNKKRALIIENNTAPYPQTFSNEVLQQVSSQM